MSAQRVLAADTLALLRANNTELVALTVCFDTPRSFTWTSFRVFWCHLVKFLPKCWRIPPFDDSDRFFDFICVVSIVETERTATLTVTSFAVSKTLAVHLHTPTLLAFAPCLLSSFTDASIRYLQRQCPNCLFQMWFLFCDEIRCAADCIRWADLHYMSVARLRFSVLALTLLIKVLVILLWLQLLNHFIEA